MAQTGVDSYGAWLDTGTSTPVTARASTEEEIHAIGEVDTASKNTIPQTVASHGPHRPKNSPR